MSISSTPADRLSKTEVSNGDDQNEQKSKLETPKCIQLKFLSMLGQLGNELALLLWAISLRTEKHQGYAKLTTFLPWCEQIINRLY